LDSTHYSIFGVGSQGRGALWAKKDAARGVRHRDIGV
jgi:hypothetical protein